MVGSGGGALEICPPIIEYSQELRGRAADELAVLSEGLAIVEILSDSAVIRALTLSC